MGTDKPDSTITVIFSDVAENHARMQKLGRNVILRDFRILWACKINTSFFRTRYETCSLSAADVIDKMFCVDEHIKAAYARKGKIANPST
jgi:hypothetical protein